MPEEIFFRAFRAAEFDICEMSLSSTTVKTAQGNCPYVAVPAFVSRMFRHTSVYVRTDRIKKPEDLKGRKVGVPEFQLTANVWARAFLEDDYGVKTSDIHWIRGGIEDAGRPEKITINLPPGRAARQCARRHDDLGMLEAGEIDGFMAPRAPTLDAGAIRISAGCFPIRSRSPRIISSAPDFSDHARHRRAPRACRQASVAAGRGAQGVRAVEAGGDWRSSSDTDATKITMPFVEERLAEARELMGDDFWSYGVEPNRHVLENFFRHHHAEGLSSRLVTVDEFFHPATYETFKL